MLIKYLKYYIFLYFHLVEANRYLSFGPDIKATLGEVWPKPLWQNNTGRYYAVDPNNFQLVVGYFKNLIKNMIFKRKQVLNVLIKFLTGCQQKLCINSGSPTTLYHNYKKICSRLYTSSSRYCSCRQHTQNTSEFNQNM